MNKETYEALKRLSKYVAFQLTKHESYPHPTACSDMKQVESWIDEVAKEHTECSNKDKNGNACWNCEMGEDGGECGTAEDERSCVKCGKTSDLIEEEDMCYTCAKERSRV